MAEFLPAFTEHGLPGLIVLLSFAFSVMVIKRCMDFMDAAAARHEARQDAILESHRAERELQNEKLSVALNALTAAIQHRRHPVAERPHGAT